MKRWVEINWLKTATFAPTRELGCPYSLRRIAREEWGVHFITHHRPEFCVFVFWHNGVGVWTDDQGTGHELGRGSYVLSGLHTGPVIINAGDEAMTITTIYFDARDANPFEQLGGRPPVAGMAPQPAATEALLDWLLETALLGGSWARRSCSHALSGLFESCRAGRYPQRDRGAPYQKYLECRSHMEYHAERITTVEQLADECNIDVSYLSRLFRRFDRVTPYARLSELRMEQAAALLSNAWLSIRDISDILGFSDQYAFSKAFKRVLGVPPTTYRRQTDRERKRRRD